MKEILNYYNNVIHANSEEAKKLLLFNLLMELYKKNDEIKEIISKMSLGAEKMVFDIPINKCSTKTGRVDTQYGKVIIEFEKDLNKTKNHAEEQLKEYLLGNWNMGNVYNYTLISTDGIRWIIYGLKPESFIGRAELTVKELELKILDWIVLDESKSFDFFRFIDRYLFRYEKQDATLDNIQIDFGESSPLFITVIGELKSYWQKIQDNPDIQTALNEWYSFLSIAYGTFKGSADIFLVHSYLSVFSKFLAYSVITHDDYIDDDEMKEILEGSIFKKFQVANFIENDFYRWVINPKYFWDLRPAFRRIATKISDYDFSNIKSDILKGVYQELIDLETRHALGEYYTPDWLCRKIVENYDFKTDSKILDPACGSGSFLLAAINRMKQLHHKITIEELSSQIVGIDIHPLSVQVAKTTLLLAFGNLIKNAKRPVHLQVFLSNSILSPEGTVSLFGKEFMIKFDGNPYFLPEHTFENPMLFDYAVSVADQLAESSLHKNPENKEILHNTLKKHFLNPIDDVLINKFYEIYLGFKKAKENGRDGIWKFVLQNSYKPFFFKKYFDFVVGNPPWLTYSSVRNSEYQNELKKLAEKYNVIPEKKANMPHLEIASIFMAHAASYFLKDKGKLAFVLPRSFISAEHHDNSRTGKAYGYKIESIWDLEKVIPLFNVPSCVFFVSEEKVLRMFPKSGITGLNFSGRIKKQNSTWDEVSTTLKTDERKWYLSKLGKSSALTNQQIAFSTNSNFYKKHFKQGATIVPRNFYFIKVESEIPPDWNDRIISIVSHPENDKDAKKPWKGLHIKGQVNTSYLFLHRYSKKYHTVWLY